jgi:hypothetical protein
MAYTVTQITDKKGMKEFVELSKRIYANDPNFVSPLDSEIERNLDPQTNPYFKTADIQVFLCRKNDKPVSRAVVVINHAHIKRFGVKTAFFGFFESENDLHAAKCLFEKIFDYCKKEDIEYLEGPFNPNHYSELGLLVDNFDTPPAFFETYNPPYYRNLLKSVGFGELCQLHTRMNTEAGNYVRNKYSNALNIKHKDFKVRHFRLLKMSSELEKIREVYNDAFSNNWHFLPLTKEEYLFSAKYLLLVTFPKLVTIIEHKKRPVGVLQCVLDINPLLQSMKGKPSLRDYMRFIIKRRSIDNIVIYAIGVKKAYQNTDVFKLLFKSLCKQVLKYRSVSTTWMTEDNNKVNNCALLLGLKPYKHFMIYQKHLKQTPNET